MSETGERYYNDMFRSRGPECTRISERVGEGDFNVSTTQ